MSDFTHHPHDLPPQKLRPRFRLLRWIAARLPRRCIPVDGEAYLERYYIAGPIDSRTAAYWPIADRPRQRLGWLLRRTWYLHRFHSPDVDQDLHNHPWDARGRILAGAYLEARAEAAPIGDKVVSFGLADRVVWEGAKTHVTPGQYHRIKKLLRSDKHDPEAEVWTLLRCTPVVQSWGFLVGMYHVDHEDYHARCTPREREDVVGSPGCP